LALGGEKQVEIWLVGKDRLGCNLFFAYLLHRLLGLAGFHLRYLWLLLFILAWIFSCLKVRRLPFFTEMHLGNWAVAAFESALSILFMYLITGAVGAHFYDTKPVDLSFPFKDGVYSPYWGGNGKASAFMNYHYLSSVH
jgi:hypothetical protein